MAEVMPDPTKCRRVTSIVALFLFVPVHSFLHKMTYAQQAVGCPGKPAHRFVKPWFQTGLMFIGMSVSLAIYMIMTCVNRTKYPVFTSIGWRKVLFLAIPTLLDLISTVLTAVGVIYLGVSVVAILNTSKALFSALCRALVFKKPIFAHQWLGMGVMALAILTVGSSAFFIDVAIVNPPSNGVIFGALGGKLVAEFARALKMSLEQKVLQEDSVNPLIAVGLEGCFGLVITLAVFYPIFQFVPAAEGSGLHEDLVDTFLMMRNNHTIIALASVGVVMVLLFNICLMTLVETTNAVLAALYGENSGDEDDDYLDMSRYLRYNNFVLGHWTIPVAHGFRMFSGLGAAFGAYVMGDMEEEEFVADAMHIIGGELLAGPLNATDLLEYDAERDEVNMSVGNYFVNWIPSFLTPVAETIINRDFMGNPIHREPFTLQQEKYVPMVARSLPGTNPFLVNLTEKWAGLFGYDPDLDSEVSRNKEDSGLLSQWGDVSASSLEHILEGYGGGLLTTVNDVWKLAWKMHEGDSVELSDIPVLKKLNRSVSPEKAILRDYYRLKEYIDWYTAKLDVENRNMVKPFIDAVSRGESIRRYTWMQGNPQIAPIYEFEAYKRMIDEFYELERTLRSTGSKGSEEELRAERIKIQKRAARVENRVIMELNKERALRMGRYDDIKDEKLRGLGQYLDAARRMYFAPLEGRGRE